MQAPREVLAETVGWGELAQHPQNSHPMPPPALVGGGGDTGARLALFLSSLIPSLTVSTLWTPVKNGVHPRKQVLWDSPQVWG